MVAFSPPKFFNPTNIPQSGQRNVAIILRCVYLHPLPPQNKTLRYAAKGVKPEISNGKPGPLLWCPPTTTTGGGEFSWHFNFAWEIWRFKLTAKFPTRNSGFSVNFLHTSGTHCGLWRVVIHSTRGLREISHSEIYHHNFDLARIFLPSCTQEPASTCVSD